MSVQAGKGTRIFNIIKIVLLAIIAIALVKFAFFPPHSSDSAQSLDPSGDYGDITIVPETATITNTVNLEGTIQSDPATHVKATLAGEITEIYVNDGDQVNAGDTILLIQKEIEPEPVLPQTHADGQPPAPYTPPQPTYKNEWVTAPASGKISLSALLSQMVSVGDVIGAIQPPTFSAVATLTPDQMYRVEKLPEKATISIKNGPAPFECTGLKIETPHNRAPKESDNNSAATTIEARCPISTDQKVFPGLQVTMGLIAGEAQDALTVPVSAVEGRFQHGIVYIPGKNGEEPQKINVTLGLTDGKRIQIIDGLSAGQEILEFIPGKKVDNHVKDGFPGGNGGEEIAPFEETTESGAASEGN